MCIIDDHTYDSHSYINMFILSLKVHRTRTMDSVYL